VPGGSQSQQATIEPIKHVIEEYKHRAQTVTCVCGWHGSTETLPGQRTSEWSLHVAANRPRKR
jgi:hypothetical protein